MNEAGGAQSESQPATDTPSKGTAQVLRLSLKEAIAIALAPEGNVRARMAAESLRQARARAGQSRAALLPRIEASVSEQNLTRNLEAFGIRLNIPVPGFSAPVFVGPFNVFDARASASQSILDLSLIRRHQASRAGVLQAGSESESAQDLVRREVASLYLNVQRADQSLETARANVSLSEALLKQAADLKEAGTGTGIEVTRARVQLANVRQLLLVAENERERSRLELLRALGLGLDGAVEIADRLNYTPVEPIILDQAVQRALESRADWKAQREREESVRLGRSAAWMERLPSVSAFADYGSIGTSIHNAIPTHTYGVNVRVPVFDGGRREARMAETSSQYRQERIRTEDLRKQIELEIRLALDSLRSASEQVKAAEEGLTLAEGELVQAQRRYSAGMTTGLEVTDAQTRLQRARDNRIAALFNHNLARIDLAAAMGTIRNIAQ
jgi:outer membrane protein TolC